MVALSIAHDLPSDCVRLTFREGTRQHHILVQRPTDRKGHRDLIETIDFLSRGRLEFRLDVSTADRQQIAKELCHEHTGLDPTTLVWPEKLAVVKTPNSYVNIAPGNAYELWEEFLPLVTHTIEILRRLHPQGHDREPAPGQPYGAAAQPIRPPLPE